MIGSDVMSYDRSVVDWRFLSRGVTGSVVITIFSMYKYECVFIIK